MLWLPYPDADFSMCMQDCSCWLACLDAPHPASSCKYPIPLLVSRFVPDTWPATSSHQQPPPVHVHILRRYHLALFSSLCNNTNTFSFILRPSQDVNTLRWREEGREGEELLKMPHIVPKMFAMDACVKASLS